MQPIKELADSRERDAGRLLYAARQLVEEREQKLGQLVRYRDEYLAATLPGGTGTDALRLANFSTFLDRLNDSIREQQRLVGEARDEAERRTAEWQALKVEAAALSKAVERLRQEEVRDSDRREQRDHDELSTQRSTKPPP